ncbi:MAG: hypothetical protein GXP34_08860 [Actinobacteria bacterium]|nr:hypothetical protein [Actinomycetota bacterium]
MEQSAGLDADRLARAATRVIIDAAGPPILNEAAAQALLRILLRAADRNDVPNVAHPVASAVRSVS